MPELVIRVAGVEAVRYAAVPTLSFRLSIVQATEPVPIQSIALQCQIRIDTRRRNYRVDEQERLSELFGEPERWSRSLNSMLWTHAAMTVPAFASGSTAVDLPVPCTFDFNVAATKYFHGLRGGEAPLELLFSGSIFYRNGDGRLEIDMISWNKEARYRLPVSTWQQVMDVHYPNGAWLRLDRQVFDALHEYKRRHGYTGFDEALASLLPAANEAQAS